MQQRQTLIEILEEAIGVSLNTPEAANEAASFMTMLEHVFAEAHHEDIGTTVRETLLNVQNRTTCG